INISAFDTPWFAGVWLHRELFRRHIRDAFDGIQHDLGPNAAVQAKYIGSPFFQALCEHFRWRAFQAVAVFFDGHLHHQRPVRYIPYAANSRVNFIQIEKRFQNEYMDATVDERLCLFSKNNLRFFNRGLAPRLDANSQRADSPGYQDIIAGDVASDPGALNVDLTYLVGKTMSHQLCPVRPERVRFNNIGAGLDVIEMNLPHQFWV